MTKTFRHILSLLFCFLMTMNSSAMADLVQDTTSRAVESPDITLSLLKVTGGLFLVIIAIFGSAWAYRRFGIMSPVANDSLRIVSGVSLGAKERVILMQVGEEQILLGISPGSIQRLHVLTKNIEFDTAPEKQNSAFSAQLNTALKQWKSR